MTRLNQIVAIEKGEKSSVNKETAPLFHATKNSGLFAGLTKTYEPVEEDGEQFPDESAKVQHTVVELLSEFGKHSTRLLDIILTKETANTEASADVRVGDEVIIPQAPVSFLLQLEKYLQQEVKGLVTALPVLDPSQTWTASDTERNGIFETEEIKRHKTKKIAEPLVLAPATDKHPAQVQLVTRDVVAGYWSEKKFSGAISASRKQQLLAKVDELINAVKFAREEANSIQVTDKKAGAAIFGYLFS